MDRNYDAAKVSASTMATLKDFQRETVEHVIDLFRQGRNRVLVADEVGLGKTVVARGVIAKFAELREQEGDDLVKVAYICSNQSIAGQNVRKLRLTDSVSVDLDSNESRLSMQHLRITEQENDSKVRNGYVQIIPLTPETSFRMTGGSGLRRERALIYAVLKYVPEFRNCLVRLKHKLFGNVAYEAGSSAVDSWNCEIQGFEKRIEECRKASGEKYPRNFIAAIMGERHQLRQAVDDLLNNSTGYSDAVRRIRIIFAEESAAMLKPDLVIMDEFQRFRFLIASESESETRILVDRFLKDCPNDPRQKVRVLLLSATPYKLYSTAAEISESGTDEEYQEFIELLKFLFEGREDEALRCWNGYAKQLRTVGGAVGSIPGLIACKQTAEDMLSRAICRTERIAVMDDGDYVSEAGSTGTIEIAAGDVASYLEFTRMLKAIDPGIHLPIDYVKSCPYLMSYLRGYQVKEKIESELLKRRDRRQLVERAKGRYLWLKKGTVAQYRELPKVNARLEALKKHAFAGNAALFMWIPPTLPYYPMGGVYRNAETFSKVLVFSSWEMVPRMISTLISYEAERRTVAHVQGEQANYYKKHSERLRTDVKGEFTAAYEALVAPNDLAWLVKAWDPIETMNTGLSLPAIERLVREKVRARFSDLGADQEQILVDKVLGSPAVCIARRIGLSDGGESAKELALVFWKRFNSQVGTAVVDRAYVRKRDDAFHWQNVLRYCKDGCFQAMFDEYFAVVWDEINFTPEGNETTREEHWKKVQEVVQSMKEGLSINTASYTVDTYKALEGRVCSERGQQEEMTMRTHYAVCFAKGKDEESSGVKRKETLRRSFNSPMRPFVLASTSIGQEGLDFHPYCRKIMHWNLPSNPIDLEQREGRINRYKCLAVRENVALKYGKRKFGGNVWAEVYAAAEAGERRRELPELVPFWCFGRDQQVKIERIVPKYPCSRDEQVYDRLISILSVYRLSLGQPRQEELLEGLLRECSPEQVKELKKLFLNLSPFMRKLVERRGV